MNTRALLAVVVAGLVVVSTPMSAQVPSVASTPYVVQKDDNLWSLAQVKLQDPKKWKRLLELNPFLKAPGRVFEKADGTTVVLIKPGERLTGLDELGIIPQPAVNRPPTLMDIPPIPQRVEVTGIPSRKGLRWREIISMISLGVISAYFMWLLMRAFEKRRSGRNTAVVKPQAAANNNPVTAGPPMTPGGVNATNADKAFQQMASRQNGGHYQDFVVLKHTQGRVHGQMTVAYADGTEREWVLTGQQAWQARVLFPNGHVETLYMLKACGNDLRFGGVHRYQPGADFRFVPDPVVAPEVAPQPAVTPVTPPTEPTAVATTEAEPVPVGTIRVEVKSPEGDRPALVRVHGVQPEGASFEMSEQGFTLRYIKTSIMPMKQAAQEISTSSSK